MPFRLRSLSSIALSVTFIVFSAATLVAQTSPTAGARASKGMPARVSANEYLGHAQVGAITIGAEFDEHSVPTPEALLTTEDYVSVEVGLFGAAGSHIAVSSTEFSLRINGKKAALPSEQFAAVFRNLRDPSWIPPEQKEKEKPSKTGSLGGAGGDQGDQPSTPAPVHIPPDLERAMQLKVQNAALPEGDRALPVAGIIFFRYGGAAKGIHTVELLYDGPAGKATIKLQ